MPRRFLRAMILGGSDTSGIIHDSSSKYLFSSTARVFCLAASVSETTRPARSDQAGLRKPVIPLSGDIHVPTAAALMLRLAELALAMLTPANLPLMAYSFQTAGSSGFRFIFTPIRARSD